MKYIKSVLWRVAKCLSYIEEARCLKVKRSGALYSAHTIHLWVSYDAQNEQLLLPYKYQSFKATGYNTVSINKSSIQMLYILPTKSTYVMILTNVTAIFLYVRETKNMHLCLINLFQLNYPLHVSNKQVHHQEVISVQRM